MKNITLKTKITAIYFLLASLFSFSQDFKVLVFHKTNGYRHTNAINASITMLEELGANTTYDSWSVDNTQDASTFTTENLAQYDVIVFANTSGGGLLDQDQKTAMETFIKSGKGFVGFHAATDTYRNTNDESQWFWYNELVGGIVQTSPNHSPNNTAGIMNVLTDHPVTDHIDQTWSHDEEWYYWELNGGQLSTDNTNLLEVQSTGDNSYDAERPITWLKEYDGGRAFYTALGHNASTYQSNDTFRKMIEKAVLWTANRLVEFEEICDTNAPFGEIIALQKSGGNKEWIAIDANSTELTASATFTNSALFEVENHGDGCVALKSLSNDKYLQVNGTNITATLKANGNNPGAWENFGWNEKTENTVTLKSLHNNGWLSANWNEDNNPILSKTFNYVIVDNTLSTQNTPNETFKIFPNPAKNLLNINANSNTILKKILN